MITKLRMKLRTKGVKAIAKSILHRAFPSPTLFASNLELQPLFSEKIGLEIGGPSSIFKAVGNIPVYTVAERVDNCNFGKSTLWEGEVVEGKSFYFNKYKDPGEQFITEASDLSDFNSEIYDFVLSSHCIEHLANPLQGLSEWLRVLKQEGVLVLALPHKNGTFDHNRPVTSLTHLVQDFSEKMSEGDMTHLEEILELHDLDKDPCAGSFDEFKERSEKNIENRCLHHHVFDTQLAIEMVHYMGVQILAVEVFQPFHILIIGKKLEKNKKVNNDSFRTLRPDAA